MCERKIIPTIPWRRASAVVLLLFSLDLIGCSKPPLPPPMPPAQENRGIPYTVDGKTYYPLLTVDNYVERGIASWYGPGFHGRKTSSGEVYNMHSFTAAHRILPFGALVQVTNTANQKRTLVRINDRGPFRNGRIIDLSYKGAQELAMIGQGTAPVELVVVGVDAQYAGRRPTAERPYTSSFAIQIGAFTCQENAERLKEKLSFLHKDVYISPASVHNQQVHRVRIGTYKTVNETMKVQKSLVSHGYQNAFMVVE